MYIFGIDLDIRNNNFQEFRMVTRASEARGQNYDSRLEGRVPVCAEVDLQIGSGEAEFEKAHESNTSGVFILLRVLSINSMRSQVEAVTRDIAKH